MFKYSIAFNVPGIISISGLISGHHTYKHKRSTHTALILFIIFSLEFEQKQKRNYFYHAEFCFSIENILNVKLSSLYFKSS